MCPLEWTNWSGPLQGGSERHPLQKTRFLDHLGDPHDRTLWTAPLGVDPIVGTTWWRPHEWYSLMGVPLVGSPLRKPLEWNVWRGRPGSNTLAGTRLGPFGGDPRKGPLGWIPWRGPSVGCREWDTLDGTPWRGPSEWNPKKLPHGGAPYLGYPGGDHLEGTPR
jgi:hypothetical protein